VEGTPTGCVALNTGSDPLTDLGNEGPSRRRYRPDRGEIAGRLVGLDHEVVAVFRRCETQRLLGTQSVGLAFRSATPDVDAATNCVGVLQGNGSDSLDAPHARGPAVLLGPCEAAGVRRVIHFSAVGVDRGARSSFSPSKAVGNADLQARDLD
jgi:uncharacterized protein YbjT (DUF2867 family)